MYNFLVVDDERAICDGMREVLEKMELFNLSVAYNGAQALKVLQTESIDAMFLDIAMPDMDGLELMQQLEGYKKKPVTIVISGYEEFDYAKQALSYGALDYVLKPIDSDDVREMGNRIHDILQEDTLKKEKIETIRKFVSDNRKTIKQKLLYDILNSDSTSINLEDIHSVYGIDLLGKYFCATIIQAKKQDEQVSELDFQVALKMIEEYIEEEIDWEKGANLFNMENTRYVLLFSAQDAFEKEWITSILLRVVERIKTVKNAQCFIGKGNEVEGLYNIARSYYNANDALEYQSMFGPGFVYDINDYRKNTSIQMLDGLTRELETRLGFMQYDVAREKLEAIYNQLEQCSESITASQKSFYISKSIVTFLSILFENGQDAEGIMPEGVMLPTLSISTEPLSNIKMRVFHMYDLTVRRISNGYFKKHKKIAYMVKEQIDENYSDSDLSVNGLSHKLHYSPNYIGNVFKREYDMTINDYMQKVRIENAKRLISETDLKIYEIAEMVGFNDQRYFGKVFKKLVNLTPKEYSLTK